MEGTDYLLLSHSPAEKWNYSCSYFMMPCLWLSYWKKKMCILPQKMNLSSVSHIP